MSISESLAVAIRRAEPKLTEVVLNERPGHDKSSIRVASFAALTTASIALLNSVDGQSQATRTEIDLLTQRLPSFVEHETVQIEHVILDPDLCSQARSRIKGPKVTAPTALAIAYNICGPSDMKLMLSLDKGPFGPLGGIAAVLSERLVGRDKAANMFMEAVEIVSSLAGAIRDSAAQGVPKQGSGCVVASIGLFLGASAVAGGAVAIAGYLV